MKNEIILLIIDGLLTIWSMFGKNFYLTVIFVLIAILILFYQASNDKIKKQAATISKLQEELKSKEKANDNSTIELQNSDLSMKATGQAANNLSKSLSKLDSSLSNDKQNSS